MSTTIEVRPAIRRLVDGSPGRAARTLRDIEAILERGRVGEVEAARIGEHAEEIRRALAGSRRCRRCGKALTDPTSVAEGIGRDCAAKENSR